MLWIIGISLLCLYLYLQPQHEPGRRLLAVGCGFAIRVYAAILWLIVWKQGRLRDTFLAIRQAPAQWLLWSTVGFGLFYMPLSMASVYGESWFVAATWQVTIVAGVLLTPLFGKRIPVRNLAFSVVILAGIFLLQVSHLKTMKTEGLLTALGLIIIAGFSYPLGNRKCCSMPPLI